MVVSILTVIESVSDKMSGKLDDIQHRMKLLILKEHDFVLVLAFGIFILLQAGFWDQKMPRRSWGLQSSLAATAI
jgi:hypothetical protein